MEQQRKSTAGTNARFVRIARVSRLKERADVWCLTVPGLGHFSLANGAVVHNCDAFRQWATGYSPAGAPEGERRGYEGRGGSLIRGAY